MTNSEREGDLALNRMDPKNASELVSSALTLYREYFSPILGIVVIVEVPWTFLTSAVQWVSLKTLAPPRAADQPFTWGWDLAVSAALAFLGGLLSLVVMGVLARAVARHQVGQDVGIGEAYAFALRRIGSLLGAGLMMVLLVLALAATLVGIPLAVFFMVSWVFLAPAVVLEGKGAKEALGRSAALVKGHWWRTFGVLLLAFLIVMAVSLPLGMVSTLIGSGNAFLQSLLLGLLLVPTAPILPLVILFKYYDLRVRKEGFGPGQLASEVGDGQRSSTPRVMGDEG